MCILIVNERFRTRILDSSPMYFFLLECSIHLYSICSGINCNSLYLLLSSNELTFDTLYWMLGSSTSLPCTANLFHGVDVHKSHLSEIKH